MAGTIVEVGGIGGLGRGRGVFEILTGFGGSHLDFELMLEGWPVFVVCWSSRKTEFGRRVLPFGVGSSDLDDRCNLQRC